MSTKKFTVFLLPQEEGGYAAHFPYHPSCYTWGDTVEATLERARDSIATYLDALEEDGQDLSLAFAILSHVVVAEVEAELSPAVLKRAQQEAAELRSERQEASAPVKVSA